MRYTNGMSMKRFTQIHGLLAIGLFGACLFAFSIFVPTGAWGQERVAEDEEEVDLKPHFSSFALVELFLNRDSGSGIRIQKIINTLEATTGNRRGRVMFLTYVLPKEKTGVTGVGEVEVLEREGLQRRWEMYGPLLKTHKRVIPELVINGKKYLPASPPETFERGISLALLKPSKVALTLHVKKSSPKGIQVLYQVEGLPKSRSDDLYHLVIAAVSPHQPVKIYSLEGVDSDSIWENAVLGLDLVRLEEDGQGFSELHLSESDLPSAKEIVGILQDARTGQPVAGESIRLKTRTNRAESAGE